MQDENTLPVREGGQSSGNSHQSDDTPLPPVQPFWRRSGVHYFAGGALILLLSAGISALVASAARPATVVFDMKGTIDAFRQQSALNPLTKEAAEVLTNRFSRALNNSLSDWQQHHSALILVKGAVVNGAEDITPEIQADIARQMKEAR